MVIPRLHFPVNWRYTPYIIRIDRSKVNMPNAYFLIEFFVRHQEANLS